MNYQTLLQNFCLNIPVEYHAESLERLRKLEPSSLRKAAVLIACVERHDGLHIILTKRANHLRHHPGQISFPGGKLESFDNSLQQTAIREANEEIGLDPKLVTILGQLPPLMTFSQFMVTPVIALVNKDYQTTIDANEVDTVFEVPAAHLFDIDQLYSQVFQLKTYSHRIFAIPYKEHFIWGVTAQIIQALQLQLN
ncbi:CoA pyrophosphatase [Vibrio sp. DW001]|uniref:CoA pyrophosphatase n=1 Tax=Vibrio sp. DW001 TaxID=2912315 RepID=UPI0023B17D94|nr:CoA pyrophosphatase [Vibrio sp. DW001]WED28022.1 CoA pyrophosphatase [Vibrio sp. DW001]